MNNKNLKLNAISVEDLRVISAHLQDSITQVKDIVHLKKNRIFLIQFNRFINCHRRCLSQYCIDKSFVVFFSKMHT